MPVIDFGTTEFFCPDCELYTAGIIMRNGKRVCPRCGRELWKCSQCNQFTFGKKENQEILRAFFI